MVLAVLCGGFLVPADAEGDGDGGGDGDGLVPLLMTPIVVRRKNKRFDKEGLSVYYMDKRYYSKDKQIGTKVTWLE